MRLILSHHGLIPLGAECKDARVQCFRHTLKNHTWSTLIWSTPPQQSLVIPVLLWDIKLHKSNGHVTNSGITFWNFGAICTPLLLSLLKIVRSLCIQFCKCQHTFFFFCILVCGMQTILVAVKEMDFILCIPLFHMFAACAQMLHAVREDC